MDQRRTGRLDPKAIHPNRLADGRSPTGRGNAKAPEAGIGHAAVVGAVIGYFVVLTVVGGIVLAAGAGLGVAVAVGAYVAIWGGPGCGRMIGAQRYADRIAADERRAQSPQRPEVEPEHRLALDVLSRYPDTEQRANQCGNPRAGDRSTATWCTSSRRLDKETCRDHDH